MLRRHVVGLTITKAQCQQDTILFPYTEASEFEHLELKLTGAKVILTGRHGKYFWLRLSLGVLLMHFGMTGMIKLRDVDSHMIFMENGGDKKVKDGVVVKEAGSDEWPPRFCKFELAFDNGLELAFRDPRRLARFKWFEDGVDTDEALLNIAPLAVLGPDYSKPRTPLLATEEPFTYGDPDPDPHGRPHLDYDGFAKLVLSRKKPLKSMLLDQTLFCGVGNWVADEVCYQSRIHPNEVLLQKILDSDHPALKTLYEKLIYVCLYAVGCEADVTKYPEDWLMLHRWGKGRKQKATVASGHVVEHVTIGGRTSCFVPELQKKLPRPTGGGDSDVENHDPDDDVTVKTESETTTTKSEIKSETTNGKLKAKATKTELVTVTTRVKREPKRRLDPNEWLYVPERKLRLHSRIN